jgi:hypothetical protein
MTILNIGSVIVEQSIKSEISQKLTLSFCKIMLILKEILTKIICSFVRQIQAAVDICFMNA